MTLWLSTHTESGRPLERTAVASRIFECDMKTLDDFSDDDLVVS
eukprot:IDg21284t1